MDDLSSSLLCQENKACLEVEVRDEEYSMNQQQSQKDCGVFSEDEHVGVLIQKEIGFFGFKKDETLVFEDWLKRARFDAINWILKTRATLSFRFQTAYLSVIYLDQFLSRRSIDSEKCWAIRLLSIACLSLAAKMEECNVPGLSEFQLEDYSFNGKVIQKMELLVLTTLEWNMGIITPFAFLSYFIKKFCNQSLPSPNISNTIQLIFTVIMEEVNLMDHKPSVIAAAATLMALDQQLTIEAVRLKMNSISQLLQHNDVFACYNLIQRLYKEKIKRDELLCTPNSSLIRSRPIDIIESSLVSSAAAAMTKRRRLTFIDDEEGLDRKGPHQENPKL